MKNNIYNPIQERLQTSQKQNKDIKKLKALVNVLISGENLNPKYRDHQLTGNWKGHRDCHIEPDWLLIYQINETNFILEATGSHAELFK